MDKRESGGASGKDDLVGRLCELHSRMLPSRYERSWRPLRIEVSLTDADTVLKAAITLEKIRLALGDAPNPQPSTPENQHGG